MKLFKKIMALVIAMVMVLSMSMAVFAADGDTPAAANPKLINESTSKHTYEVFQIFTGTYADGQLQGLKLGKNATGYSETDTNALTQDQMTYLAGLTDTTDNQTDIENMAQFLNLSSTAFGTVAPGANLEVPVGYYLLRDTSTSPSDKTTSKTFYLLKVVSGDYTIVAKDSTVTSDKEVKDINDTEDTEVGDWQKSADWDIGDKVPFRLTATLPSNYTDYKTYHLTFHDTESAGLTFDANSLKVYVGDSTTPVASTNYEVKTSDIGTETFQVIFTYANLTAMGVTNNSVIHVEYESELNANAEIGGAVGNPNTSNVTFDNNPNSDQDGEEGGETPDVTVIVFTYKTVINKVDENGAALTGAEFTLTKKLKDGSEESIAVVKFTKDGVKTTKVANGTAQSEGDATKFSFNGIDDGTYVLSETVVPFGYNKMDDVTFKVEATHTADDGTKAALTELKGADQASGEVKLTFTAEDNNGSLNANVENKSGATLPSTGGIGTTIFYVLGALLVLGGTVVLVTRRRMAA